LFNYFALNVLFSEKKTPIQMFVLHFLMVLTFKRLLSGFFFCGDFACIALLFDIQESEGNYQENEDIGVSFVFLFTDFEEMEISTEYRF